MRTFLALLLLTVLGIVGANYYISRTPKRMHYQQSKVVKRDITEAVAVTGYAEPIDVWVVQAEVPGGVVEKVLVDFNDAVKEGQVLATVSSTMQKISLKQAEILLERASNGVKQAESQAAAAEAGLQAALADLDAAKRQAETTRRSVNEKLIPATKADNASDDAKKAQANVEAASSRVDQARVGQAEATNQVRAAQQQVDLARYQLDKTVLRSRWNGTILNKEIREGDILGGPKLNLGNTPSAVFEICSPLDVMQAIVKVSEADYSRVREGQKVTFKIDAYPDEVFEATVAQIRNSPTPDRTAVSYATVLKFSNKRDPKTNDWMVKPRSTVTADIVVRKVDKALAVPTTAFYFSPGQGIDIPKVKPGERVLWKLNSAGQPEPQVVTTGVSDGTYTQIENGPLKEGDEVIVGRPKESAKSDFYIPIGN